MSLKWTRNPFRAPPLHQLPPHPRVREFHRGLPGYAVTPLVECRRAAGALGVGAVWVKDESARCGLNAFKVLGASWAMSRIAAQTGSLPVFAAATDGNHGRAVAWMARRMGAAARIFVPANTPPARINLIRREGAEVSVIAGTYDDALRACARESAENSWQVVADTGYTGYTEIPHWVVEGYSTLFAEYAGQEVVTPDLVFVQAGVGGLLCAAVHHFTGPRIVCVEPLDADCLRESIASPDGQPRTATGAQNSIMQGLNCGEVSLTAWPTVRRGVDWFIAIEDALAREAMDLLAPIDSGESGAAGLAGLIAACRDPRLKREMDITGQTRVLVMNTESRV